MSPFYKLKSFWVYGGEAYKFVAGPFQEMNTPMTNRTTPWMTPVDGSSGSPLSSTAARGTAEPALIGYRRARASPILPPRRPPKDVAMPKTGMQTGWVPVAEPDELQPHG